MQQVIGRNSSNLNEIVLSILTFNLMNSTGFIINTSYVIN